MKSMRALMVGTTLGVLLMAATGFADDVRWDFDKDARFAGYKTYAWVQGLQLADAFNHKRIVSALEAELAAKGFAKVDANAAPDVYVAYHAIVERDRQLAASGIGGYPFGGLRSGTARLEDVLFGTLAVDIIDAHTESVVWRASVRKELDPEAKPEKRDKGIHKAAAQLMENYPPKHK